MQGKHSCMRADQVPHCAGASYWPLRPISTGRDHASGGLAIGVVSRVRAPRNTVSLRCLQLFEACSAIHVRGRRQRGEFFHCRTELEMRSSLDPHRSDQVSSRCGIGRIRSPRPAVNGCVCLAGETRRAKQRLQSEPATALSQPSALSPSAHSGRSVEIHTAARPHISMSPAVTLRISSGSFVCRKPLREQFEPSDPDRPTLQTC